MHTEDFGRLMKGLASTTHKRFDADELEFWYRALADVPDDALREAFYRFVSTGDDWPSIAKLRALADEQLYGQEVVSGDAFGRIVQAVKRFGSYQPAEGLASLDPISRQALDACGGWSWACELGTETRQAFAGQFDRAYKAIVARNREHRRTPEAIRPAITNHQPDAARIAFDLEQKLAAKIA